MTSPVRARETAPRPRRPDASIQTADQTQAAHQEFIRSLPCLACGKPAPSEFVPVLGAVGLGVSPNERYLVPLCGPATIWSDCCHSRLHYRGPRHFWSELGIDPLDLARRLWRVSGDWAAGASLVRLARQRITYRAKGEEGPRC
jgi:hypothetical protein